MEEFAARLKLFRDAMERKWGHLTAEHKRKIVLCAFGSYLVLTLTVMVQVVCQFGTTPEKIKIDHIAHPVAKPVVAGKNELKN